MSKNAAVEMMADQLARNRRLHAELALFYSGTASDIVSWLIATRPALAGEIAASLVAYLDGQRMKVRAGATVVELVGDGDFLVEN